MSGSWLFTGDCAFERALNDLDGGLCLTLVAASTIFWVPVLLALKYLYFYVVGTLLMGRVNPERTKMPRKVPVVEPKGSMLESSFDLPVSTASLEQIRAFLSFRGIATVDKGNIANMRRTAAQEAVAYRGELYSDKYFEFMDERFDKQNKKWPIPFPIAPWNGWSGCFAENGRNLGLYLSGSFAYACQHALSGLLAAYFLYVDRSPYVFRLALYLDCGFNCVDLILMSVSIATGKDLSILSGLRQKLTGTAGLFKMLLMHHLGAAVLEMVGLYLGVDAVFGSEMMIALLGTTGMLHFAAVLLIGTPFARNDKCMLVFYQIVAVCMVWFRGIKWVSMVWTGLNDAFSKGGWVAFAGCGMGFLIFTLFNIEFVLFYVKQARKSWSKVFGNQGNSHNSSSSSSSSSNSSSNSVGSSNSRVRQDNAMITMKKKAKIL